MLMRGGTWRINNVQFNNDTCKGMPGKITLGLSFRSRVLSCPAWSEQGHLTIAPGVLPEHSELLG
jgi:hypothetical protein